VAVEVLFWLFANVLSLLFAPCLLPFFPSGGFCEYFWRLEKVLKRKGYHKLIGQE